MKGNAADRERYTYDADGNITAIHENGKLKVRYHYDGLNRLVREDNQPLKLTTTYTYDNSGNLLRQNEYAYSLSPTDELANGTEVVYTYGNENHPDQLTNYNGKAIVYNANGCPTNYLGNACTYEGGRLKTFGSNTFDYDADGLRTKKNNIVYTYIDGRLVQQSGNSKPPLDFIYGPTGLVGFKYDNILYLYRRNQMGDVTHIYNTAGTLLAKYEYDAWGNHTVTKMGTNAIGDINPIRYRGYYYDKETGLYYLQSRYYDPETGRFLSQDDTAYLAPESLTGLNLYAYCNNNPVMYTDESGCAIIMSLFIGFLIGAAFGGITGAVTGIASGKTGWALVGNILGGVITGGVLGAVSTFGGLFGIGAISAKWAGVGLMVSAGASFGAGVGAYATKQFFSGQKIVMRDMLGQGVVTAVQGVFSFGVGALMGASGNWSSLNTKQFSKGISNLHDAGNGFLKSIVVGSGNFLKDNITQIVTRTLFKTALATPWSILKIAF